MAAENLTAWLLTFRSRTVGAGGTGADSCRELALTGALVSLCAPNLFPFGDLDQLDLDLPSLPSVFDRLREAGGFPMAAEDWI